MSKKLTPDGLRKLRDLQKKELAQRAAPGQPATLLVGMGTCGIAAGARAAFDALLDELKKNHLSGVSVRQTGCMGLCYSEPTVEVAAPGMPTVVYGNVTAEVAREIVRRHVMDGHLVDDHLFDKPAADLVAHLNVPKK